jgi:hypothetical protein
MCVKLLAPRTTVGLRRVGSPRSGGPRPTYAPRGIFLGLLWLLGPLWLLEAS